MSQRLKAFDGKRYEGVMEFMHAAIQEGFDNEFDNSLVLRAMWDCQNKVLALSDAAANSKVYLVAKTEEHVERKLVLTVTMHFCENPEVCQEITLFVRREGLAVFTDAVKEKVIPGWKSIDWDKAKDEVAANPCFDQRAVACFGAMLNSLRPFDPAMPKYVRMTPSHIGVRFEFIHGNKRVFTSIIEYSHMAQKIAA